MQRYGGARLGPGLDADQEGRGAEAKSHDCQDRCWDVRLCAVWFQKEAGHWIARRLVTSWPPKEDLLLRLDASPLLMFFK